MTLALVVMLQPALASAVTWNSIVDSVRATGSYSSTENDITADIDEEGALQIDGTGTIDADTTEDGKMLVLQSFETDDGKWINVIVIGAGIELNAEGGQIEVAGYSDAQSNVEVQLLGTMKADEVHVRANNESTVKLINKGTIEAIYSGVSAGFSSDEAYDQTYYAELINAGTINMEENFGVFNSGAGETRFENAGGTVNAVQVAFGVNDGENGTVTAENNGKINAEGVDVFSDFDGKVTFTNGEDGVVSVSWTDENGDVWTGEVFVGGSDGVITLKNQGKINASVIVSAHENAALDVTNEEGASITGDGVYMEVYGEGATGEFENSGSIDMEWMNLTANYGGSLTVSNNEDGTLTVGDQVRVAAESYSYAEGEHGGHTTASFTNSGVINPGRNTYIVALGDAATEFNNTGNGSVSNEVFSEAGYSNFPEDDEDFKNAGALVTDDMKASVSITNNSVIEDYLSTVAWQNGEMEIDNQNEIGDLYVETCDESSSNVTNNGDINGEFWVLANENTQITVKNTDKSTADKIGIQAYDGGQVTVNNEGTSREVIVLSNGTGDINITGDGTAELELLIVPADSADEFSAQELIAIGEALGFTPSQMLLETSQSDEEGYVFTQYKLNEDGSVGEIVYQEANGEVIVGGEGEGQPESKPEKIDWDAVYAEMRAQDEAKRQAGAVGGVTTSIFRNYQAYLGHSCYNMRMFVGGEKVTTMQSLSWLPGGDAEGKNHSFQMYVDLEKTALADIEMRVAQDYLDVCQRAGVAQITLTEKDGVPFAQFAVSDLIAAREMYGLEADELLCVSADANAEVMKIDLEGNYVPLEQAEEEAAQDAAA